MKPPLVTVFPALLLLPAAVMAQQAGAPVPLYPGAAPPSITAEPLPAPSTPAAPPPVAQPEAAPPAAAAPYPSSPVSSTPAPSSGAAATAPPTAPEADATARIFCGQPVSVRLADPDAVPEPYRKFIGIWSDASWTPSLCAALIVANVTPGGTASILYVYGPLEANPRGPGGVLRGTGVIREGELKFQNSDGSQFAFRPLYADLDGRLTTPKGEAYQAIFKQTP